MLLEPTLSRMLAAYRGPQLRATLILGAAPVLMVVWRYWGSREFLATNWPDAWLVEDDRRATAASAFFASTLFWLGVVPALLVRCVFRQPLASYGLGLGDRRATIVAIVIGAPIFVAIALWGARLPGVRELYPLNPRAGDSLGAFLRHAFAYALFYLGWEFQFRGFLLFGLRETMGDVNALLVQAAASCLLHYDTGPAETLLSLAVGWLWGEVALRTRSIWPSFAWHYALGITVDAGLCISGWNVAGGQA